VGAVMVLLFLVFVSKSPTREVCHSLTIYNVGNDLNKSGLDRVANKILLLTP
jgi:hypothetical protein